MKITIEHFRTVPGLSKTPGFCVSGGRRWFAEHGLDWRDFVRNGIDSEILLAQKDAFADAIVAHAMKGADDGRE